MAELSAKQELDLRRELKSGVAPKRELEIRRMLPVSSNTELAGKEEPKTLLDMINSSDGPQTAREALEKDEDARLIKIGQGMTKAGHGAKQFGLSTLEQFGVVEPGTTEAYTKKTKEEREFIDKAFREEFGDKFSYDFAEGLGQVAPTMAIPGAGQTNLARSIYAGATGALTGGAQFTEEEGERTGNIISGAVAGPIINQFLEIGPQVKNFFKKTLNKQLTTEKAKKIKSIADDLGIDLKASQIANDPFIESLESMARQGTAGERIARGVEAKQAAQTHAMWLRMQRKFSGKFDDFATEIDNAFRKTLGDSKMGTGLLGQRARDANKNFAAAYRASGGSKNIKAESLVSQLDELIQENSGRLAGKARQRIAKELTGLRQKLDDGMVDARELHDMLRDWGKASRGTGRVFTDKVDKADELSIAKRVYGSLSDDLDRAASSNISGATELKLARDSYAAHTQQINSVRDSALGKIFGGKSPKTLEEVESAFIKMKPSQIKSTMSILSDADPMLKNKLQRFWIEQNLKKGSVVGTADTSSFDPEQMLKMVSGENRDAFKAVFDSADARKTVMDGIRVSRAIITNNQRTGGRGFARIKELAGVLASQDRTFIARLGAELTSPEILSRAVLTKEGVNALSELAKPYNQNRWTAALITLNNILQEEDQDGN